MKKAIGILIFICLTKFVNGQVLKDVKIYYNDNQTVKGKTTYRELNIIGENPWSKPEKFDIVLSFNKHVYGEGDRIEILIEELYKPKGIWTKTPDELNTKSWIPHKVVYSNIPNAIKSEKIIVKNIPYQTVYFMDSNLYSKEAFRIVGIFYNKKLNKVERVLKAIKFDE